MKFEVIVGENFDCTIAFSIAGSYVRFGAEAAVYDLRS
jgi:hypothetical protein